MKSTTRTTLLAALPLVLAACSTAGPGAGNDVPAAIAVPSGNAFAFTLKGSGLQNYECRAKAGGSGGYDWALIGPEAALRDKNDALVGRHFAGPIWEYGDGSAVSGKVLADAPAPVAGNIPWLLLKGTPSGTGQLGGVTYIQRIHTSGGTAPSDTCNASQAGAKKSVRYSADYLFYKA
jgi:predicted small secreted protein